MTKFVRTLSAFAAFAAAAAVATAAPGTQYIVKYRGLNTIFVFSVNGHSLGQFNTDGANADITRYVHRGTNMVKIAWRPACRCTSTATLTVGQHRGGHWNTVVSQTKPLGFDSGSQRYTFTAP